MKTSFAFVFVLVLILGITIPSGVIAAAVPSPEPSIIEYIKVFVEKYIPIIKEKYAA